MPAGSASAVVMAAATGAWNVCAFNTFASVTDSSPIAAATFVSAFADAADTTPRAHIKGATAAGSPSHSTSHRLLHLSVNPDMSNLVTVNPIIPHLGKSPPRARGGGCGRHGRQEHSPALGALPPPPR